VSSELQSLITVTVNGVGPIGVWDERTGGAPKSTIPKHRPGGMGPQVAYTSLVTYDNVVVTRVVDNEERSDSALYKQLMPFVGNAPATVIEQPLDANGNAFGPPTTYVGKLEDMDPGVSNSESESVRKWSLTFTITNVT
jgi:hypothetical protein